VACTLSFSFASSVSAGQSRWGRGGGEGGGVGEDKQNRNWLGRRSVVARLLRFGSRGRGLSLPQLDLAALWFPLILVVAFGGRHRPPATEALSCPARPPTRLTARPTARPTTCVSLCAAPVLECSLLLQREVSVYNSVKSIVNIILEYCRELPGDVAGAAADEEGGTVDAPSSGASCLDMNHMFNSALHACQDAHSARKRGRYGGPCNALCAPSSGNHRSKSDAFSWCDSMIACPQLQALASNFQGFHPHKPEELRLPRGVSLIDSPKLGERENERERARE
jgi:hypothetical protein